MLIKIKNMSFRIFQIKGFIIFFFFFGENIEDILRIIDWFIVQFYKTKEKYLVAEFAPQWYHVPPRAFDIMQFSASCLVSLEFTLSIFFFFYIFFILQHSKEVKYLKIDLISMIFTIFFPVYSWNSFFFFFNFQYYKLFFFF